MELKLEKTDTKELKELVEGERNVSEANIEKSLNYDNLTDEEKKATEAGYFPIFRYNPETKEFSLDSKADFSKYREFLDGETRYKSLAKVNPEHQEELYAQNEENAKARYGFYESLDKE